MNGPLSIFSNSHGNERHIPILFPEYITGYESSRYKCHRNKDNTLAEGMLLRTLFIKTLRVTCVDSKKMIQMNLFTRQK